VKTGVKADPLAQPQFSEDIGVSTLGFSKKIGQFTCSKNISTGLNVTVEKGITQAFLPHPDSMKIIGLHCQL
jgi:hypothetical protein